MEHEPLVSRETATERVARAVIADGASGLTDTQLDRLAVLVERVCSTPIGVTAIRDPATAAARHVLDALAGLPAVDAAPPGPLADVGSGGGLPGLVLGVARPERELHLIESTARKAAFITEAAAAIGVRVSVHAEDPISGVTTHTNSAYFVFVALDERGVAARVPELELESDEERAHFAEGKERQRLRVARDRSS